MALSNSPVIAAERCLVCAVARKPGAGGGGLCGRCYLRKYRGAEPSVAHARRAPGAWRSIQSHVDTAVHRLVFSAAKAAGQSISLWLQGAIREKLERSK